MATDTLLTAPPSRLAVSVRATGLLLPVVLVGTILRLQSLQEPLWLDELHTGWVVAGWFGEVGPRSVAGNQSPLFFWILWPIARLWADPPGLRLVSLVASFALGLSATGIIWWWTRSLAAAWLTAWLIAVDDRLLFVAVEARPYALLQLVALWQVVALSVVLVRDAAGQEIPARWWLATAGLTLLLFYLHPVSLLLLVGLAAWPVIARWGDGRFPELPVNRSSAVRWGLASGLAMLPGLWLLARSGANGADWDVVASVPRFGLLLVACLTIWLVPPLLAGWVGGWRPVDRLGHRGVRLPICLLVAGGLVPPLIVLATTASGLMPLALYRFVACSFLLLIVLGGGLVGCLARPGQRAGTALLVALLAALTNPLFPGWLRTGSLPAQRNEDWQSVIEQINQDPAPLVLWPNLVEDRRFAKQELSGPSAGYYRFAVAGIHDATGGGYPVEARSLAGPQGLSDDLRRAIEEAGGGWLLIRAREPEARRVRDLVLRQLKTSGTGPTIVEVGQPPLFLFRIRW